MKGKLISLVPNLMKIKGWTPTMLDDEIRKEGEKLSWPIVMSISHGEVPKTTRVVLILCRVLECQPNDVLLFVPEVE